MTCTTETYERRPGKFETSGEIGEKLYAMSMDGDDGVAERGEGEGAYVLLLDTGIPCAPHAILVEDSQGFVDYQAFGEAREAQETFDAIAAVPHYE